MKPRVLLLVDASYQIYRAAAAHPELSCAATGVFTGGIYGFMATLAKTIRETGATDCVAGLDSKPYLRSREYPQYKQVRKKAADPELKRLYDESEPHVHAFLRLIGVPLWSAPGFEFDDLAGAAVRWHRGRYDRIVAATNDDDLYQLFDCPTFSFYNSTGEVRAMPHDCTPAEFMLIKAMQGTHNDVEGIAGIGPVKAMQALRDPAKMRRLREDHGAVIDRNLGLMRLPHPLMPRVRVPGPTGRFSQRDLYRWCAGFDIDTTMSMVNAFDQLNGR